jgi:hypothetical protein
MPGHMSRNSAPTPRRRPAAPPADPPESRTSSRTRWLGIALMFTSAAAVAAVAYSVGSSHGADEARVAFETASSSAAVQAPPSDEDFPTITEDDLSPPDPTGTAPPATEPVEAPVDAQVEVVEVEPVAVEEPAGYGYEYAPPVDREAVADLVAVTVADAVAGLDAELAAVRSAVTDVAVADVVPDVAVPDVVPDVAVPTVVEDSVEDAVEDVAVLADHATEPPPMTDFEHFYAGEPEVVPAVEPYVVESAEVAYRLDIPEPPVTWSGDQGASVAVIGADQVEFAPALAGGW